jgi:four helix bundle protein
LGTEQDSTRSTYDLEDRLLEYSAMIVRIVEDLSPTRAGNHVGGQLLRSGTSPLFNHGEAQAAESQDDFIHKMSICLKELRESHRALRLIMKVPLVKKLEEPQTALKETDELIRIFVASIRTARKNRVREHADGYMEEGNAEEKTNIQL